MGRGGSDIEMNVKVTRHETAGCSRVPQDRVQEGWRGRAVLNAAMNLQVL